jgi:hypothetical protein
MNEHGFCSAESRVSPLMEISVRQQIRPNPAQVGARKGGPGLHRGLVHAVRHGRAKFQFWAIFV